jgi:hypothetical protein
VALRVLLKSTLRWSLRFLGYLSKISHGILLWIVVYAVASVSDPIKMHPEIGSSQQA